MNSEAYDEWEEKYQQYDTYEEYAELNQSHIEDIKHRMNLSEQRMDKESQKADLLRSQIRDIRKLNKNVL
jgi:hypothetical protein